MIFSPSIVVLWSECENTAEISDNEFSCHLAGVLKLFAIRFLIQHKKRAVICHCQKKRGLGSHKVAFDYKRLDLLSHNPFQMECIKNVSTLLKIFFDLGLLPEWEIWHGWDGST